MNLYDPKIREVTIDRLPVDQYVCVSGVPSNLSKLEFVKLVDKSDKLMYLACVAEIDNEGDCFWLTLDRSNGLWYA